jgi:hypothetical protein
MNISMISADSDNTASSRIRCYTLQSVLERNGIAARFGVGGNPDILFVQKKVTPDILAEARRVANTGGAIIYDVDDLGAALDYWAPPALFNEMIRLADLVTTDTEGHMNHIAAAYAPRRVAIVPDAIDYYPRTPAKLSVTEANPMRIFWFGSVSNISLFAKYTATLTALQNIEVVVATGQDSIAQCQQDFPAVTFVPWSRAGFIETLQSCHISCLMHDGSDIDRTKSNNKMITSIGWGIPAVVSSTPEYARTAREAGIEYAIFNDNKDLPGVIEKLRSPDARKDYLKYSQSIIWSLYSPQSVALSFLVCVKNLVNEKQQETSGTNTSARIQQVSSINPKQARAVLERDYLRDWVKPEGKSYRLGVYERQRKGGVKPLISNPTIDEIKAALRANNARTVLELGCGWGRIMEELVDEFQIEGCDVSQDMLELCVPCLNVFRYDVAVEDMQFLRASQNRWDVIFTRGVMLYFMEDPVQMAYAMNNMLMLAKNKIIIWEWLEVCERMRQFADNPKFEYLPIERRSE